MDKTLPADQEIACLKMEVSRLKRALTPEDWTRMEKHVWNKLWDTVQTDEEAMREWRHLYGIDE